MFQEYEVNGENCNKIVMCGAAPVAMAFGRLLGKLQWGIKSPMARRAPLSCALFGLLMPQLELS